MPHPVPSVVDWAPTGAVRLLDQTRLPAEEVYLEIDSIDAMVEAIRSLRVRGAPLIGVAAAMGLAAAAGVAASAGRLTEAWVRDSTARLRAARPTGADLGWAIDRMERVALRVLEVGGGRGNAAEAVLALRTEAQAIREDEIAMCRAIGEAGAGLMPDGATVLTHCNTGALATGGIGTALGVVTVAREQGKGISVVACETRPLEQGARLTAWELAKLGIPCRVIVDGAAASLMSRREITLVLVGADRIAANGDVANKIGTYALALAARHHAIPFYVAAPMSTIDPAIPSGDAIPIEQRAAAEIPAAPGAEVYNPAFDVTPAELVTAIITDRGVLEPPFTALRGRPSPSEGGGGAA
ncbi:MAG: S-methyl-5-thioribose-1-phosphate isomerase [Gemmatimonadales bacterium]